MKRLITLTGLLFLLLPSCSKHEIDKTPTDHLTVVLQPAVADGKYIPERQVHFHGSPNLE